jgi:hypothetical protein
MARTYQTWEQFFDDVELMCSNAMVYNEDESEVYCDARQIKVCKAPDLCASQLTIVGHSRLAPQRGQGTASPTANTEIPRQSVYRHPCPDVQQSPPGVSLS